MGLAPVVLSEGPTRRATPWRYVMGDLLYLGLTVGFFALTWAFVKLCERV
jgi:hypothetical protein